MSKKILSLLGAAVLLALLTAPPALALQPATDGGGGWWHAAVDTLLTWLPGGDPGLAAPSSVPDSGEPAPVPGGPLALEDPDSQEESSDGNTYPALDPNG